MALWKEKFAKKLEGTYASLHKRENRGCRLHILRFILTRLFNLYGAVNRALDDRQIFFGTKFQFVADPFPLFAFLPRDLRVKIPFYGKPAGFNNPHAQTGKVYWSERTIVNMLKNPTYLGHMVQGRHQVKSYKVHTIVPIPEDDWFWVENTHEAIIDQQTFDRAQELLEKNVRTSSKAKTVYLFSGFLRCGDCGRGMTRRTSKGYTYYSCKTYIMKSRGLCSSHTIRDELVEQVVFEAVKRQIDLCGSLAEIIDEINQAPVVRNQSTRLDKLLKTQEQELHKITNLCDNLYIDWKSGDLTRDEYHRMKAKFEQQAEEIRQTIANLQEEQTFVSNGITSADPYLQTFLKYKNIDHLERGIVVALIKQISIYEEKRIEVEFNFADQHQRILDFIEANQPKLRVVKSEAV